MEDLEFLLVRFNGHFTMGVFSPDDASSVFFVAVEGVDVGAGTEGFVEDFGFGTDHVDYEGDAPETVTELFPEVAGEGGFSSGAEDEYSDSGGVDCGFSQSVDSLGSGVKCICSDC